MAKQKEQLVCCRYPKCSRLHESTELKKEDAVQGGSKNHYYHPDCYHTMKTVNEIKDLFVKEINPLMTGQQIGILVVTIQNIVFNKKIDVDFLKFALEYMIKYKPGKLRQPMGLHYIIQDRNINAAWQKEQERKIRAEIKAEMNDKIQESDKGEVADSESSFVYKPPKQKGFADILG